MRRPSKPFTVEIRRASRKTAKQPDVHNLTDDIEAPSLVPADEPSRKGWETDDGTYSAALRAADAVFGNSESGTVLEEALPPLPKSWPFTAAERLFKPVDNGATDEQQARSGSSSEKPIVGRILPSLWEEDPVATILAIEAATRRRRGPARRSGLPIGLPGTKPASQKPTKAETSIRNCQDPLKREAEAPHLEDSLSILATTAPISGKLPGYVRGRIYAKWVTRVALRPGERWKRRLTG
jgi:hypothetical protein